MRFLLLWHTCLHQDRALPVTCARDISLGTGKPAPANLVASIVRDALIKKRGHKFVVMATNGSVLRGMDSKWALVQFICREYGFQWPSAVLAKKKDAIRGT